jgi:peptidoglycan hydrolase-like protein with peptidoglycan-binding domain
MSNDIQWKRSGQDLSSEGDNPQDQNPVVEPTAQKSPTAPTNDSVADALWPDENNQDIKADTNAGVTSLQKEIDEEFAKSESGSVVNESVKPTSNPDSMQSQTSSPESGTQTRNASSGHDADTLRAQILADFDADSSGEDLTSSKKAPPAPDLPAAPQEIPPEPETDSTPPTEPVRDSSLGVDQTYYSDLSSVMGSNDPRTMSELLQKARFEKKRSNILSPRSKKNIVYIIGGIILLVAALILVASWFRNNQNVSYVNDTRVQSLVFSDKDIGINTTGLGPAKTNTAIEKLLTQKVDEGDLHQVYYVQEDEFGNLRRMDVRKTFDQTESNTPDILYENIAPEFMHGVYATDQNYPFIILQALSYDRALEGMKQWEPTMINDLGTYLNLPPEAYDHSLLEDGFVDDLIANKTVRVAKFVPREKDRRGIREILDFVNPFDELIPTGDDADVTETSDETGGSTDEQNLGEETNNQVSGLRLRNWLHKLFPYAFAQAQYSVSGNVSSPNGILPGALILEQGTTNGAVTDSSGDFSLSLSEGTHTLEISFIGFVTKEIQVSGEQDLGTIVLQEDATDIDGVVIRGNTGNDDNSNNSSSGSSTETNTKVECYATEQRCFGSGENQICYDEIKNKPDDRVYDESKQGLAGFQCFSVVDADGGTVETNLTEQVCFHPVTGNRLDKNNAADLQIINSNSALCFQSAECHRYACFSGDREVALSQEGAPGVSCYETLEEVPSDFDGRKICREYPGLTLLDNIDSASLCFDPDGNYVPNGSTARDVSCISPLNRNALLCLNVENRIVPYEPFYAASYQFCFSPINSQQLSTSGDVGEQFITSNQQIRQQALAIAMQLEMAVFLADVFGLDDDIVSELRNATEFFYQVGYGNILEVDAIRRGAQVAQALEQVLNILDPGRNWDHVGPNGKLNLYGILRGAIDVIKDVLGLSHNLTWVTLNGRMPMGVTIPVGSDLPEVEPVQQALALIGILNPESVTGTLDLVSQGGLEVFQRMNNIGQSGIIDPDTLRIMNNIVEGAGKIYDGSQLANINDYLSTEDAIGLGSYSSDVQSLKIFLYAEGYNISVIDGVFDRETCLALQQYQRDNNLAVSPDGDCEAGAETIEFINNQIREKDYLGSGFTLTTNENGLEYLQGNGTLSDIVGPGVVDFSLGTRAEARGISENDIVLLYTFLDEETILITTHESVIREVIRRRALDDIFGPSN